MDLSPVTLLDCSLSDSRRRRFKVGDFVAGARDTSVFVGGVRWPGVQSVRLEDRPAGTVRLPPLATGHLPAGVSAVRVLTVVVRLRHREDWPLIPLDPFGVKVVVKHPQDGGEIQVWELPANAVVARVRELSEPGSAQRVEFRFEALVAEPSPVVAMPVVPEAACVGRGCGQEDGRCVGACRRAAEVEQLSEAEAVEALRDAANFNNDYGFLDEAGIVRDLAVAGLVICRFRPELPEPVTEGTGPWVLARQHFEIDLGAHCTVEPEPEPPVLGPKTEREQRLADIGERVEAHLIETLGVLSQPPPPPHRLGRFKVRENT